MKKVVGYPLPLGVTERNDVVNFSIVVERGKECVLCIYKKGQAFPEVELELYETDDVGEIRFTAFPKSEVNGMEYCYRIQGEYVLDPYAKNVCKSEAMPRSSVLLTSYDWEEDKRLCIPSHEVIAYSMHVRGFTKHASSKVKKKGTFQGVIEKISYLQQLGINQIQCMPVYNFEENKKYTNYWGYGEGLFFAVKDKYAAGNNPEKELKDMIKACHKAGIEVVLNFPFTDSTSKQLILECLRYYVMEYHIDGFILNPYHVPMEIVKSDPILKDTKILENRDDFQNIMRRFLKGDEDMVPTVMKWISKNIGETNSCNYITTHTGFTLSDLVSYNEKHNEENGEENQDGPDDNFSWNCGVEGLTRKKSVLDLRKKQMRNAMFLMLMSIGTPCILAGDEFGNSQNGNNNVYCQDNETAWLDWKGLDKEQQFYDYVRRLIELRKKYPILHSDVALKGTDQVGCGIPDISFHGENAWRPQLEKRSRQLGVYYHDEKGTDIYIGYNMHYEAKKLALPLLTDGKEWHVVISTATDVEEDMVCEKQILIEPRTILMFVGR